MKTKTKKILLRTVCFILVIFIILNFLISNKVYAADDDVGAVITTAMEAAFIIALKSGGLFAFGIFYLVKLVILVPGALGHLIVGGVFASLGDSFTYSSIPGIIFAGASGASQSLNVDFFDSSSAGAFGEINSAIAKWYYILRLISTAILLVILIYVGIRMALSTVADEQAKYKKMLVDWASSVALLFLLHYIIIFVVTINNSLISVLKNLADESLDFNAYDASMVTHALLPTLSSVFPCLLYTYLGWMTFSFFLMYVKRKITVGFLIMIAPLITITYSIDKMGDGKAQALNAWLKELVYNILIQPFHCIIYMCFMGAVVKLLSPEGGFSVEGAVEWVSLVSMSPYILAIVILNFMKKAEEILRKLFHFEAQSMSSMAEAGQSMMNATGRFGKIGVAAGAGVMKFKNSGGFTALKSAKADYKATKAAKKQLQKDFKAGQKSGEIDKGMNFKDYMKSDEGQEKVSEYKKTNASKMKQKTDEKRRKKQEKKEAKARKKYDEEHGRVGAYDEMIEEKVNNTKISNDELEERTKQKFEEKHGKGSYESYKKIAARKDKDGKSTRAAKAAQQELSFARDDAKNDIKNDRRKEIQKKEADKIVGTTLPTKAINGISTKFNGIKTSMKEFSESQYGKKIKEARKDAIKVAMAMGMGAAAMGLTGQANDVYSAGSLGYGFAEGLFKNSSKTVVNTASEQTEKHMQAQGISADEVPSIIENISVKMESGELKEIIASMSKDVNSLKALLGDAKAASRIDSAISKGFKPGEEVKYKETVEEEIIKAGLNEEDAQKVRIYADSIEEKRFMSLISSQMETAKSFGMDEYTYITEIINKVEKANIKVDINATTDKRGRTTYDAEASTSDGSSSSRGSGSV